MATAQSIGRRASARRPARRRGPKPWQLPPALSAFIRRRAREGAGLLVVLVGLFALLAMLTYNPADPSWNRAVDAPATNLMGAGGAVIADIAQQYIALAAILPILSLLLWGDYLLRHRRVAWVPVRLAIIPLASIVLAIGLGLAEAWIAGHGWMQAGNIGGALGGLLAIQSANVLAGYGVALGVTTAAILIAAAALSATSLPMGRQDWRSVMTTVRRAIGFLLQMAYRAVAATLSASVGLFERAADRRADHDAGDARAADKRPRGRKSTRRREPVLDTGDEEMLGDREIPRPASTQNKRVARKKPTLKTGRREKDTRQKKLDLPVPSNTGSAYQLPPLDILAPPDEPSGAADIDQESLEQNARLLESVLDDFGVRGDIVKVRPGPVVTMYELEPAPGTKTSRVIALADDIARSMSAVSVRIAVVPGRNAIGIELPNAFREMVALRELLASVEFEKSKGLSLALGKNIGGEPIFADLAKMPHLLIAGTTGSGKSVGVNAMIVSLLYRFTPDECRFIMVDPKMLELSIYDGIPHLLAPVVTEPKKAVVALKWVVREMENRYQSMSKLGVRNIDGYNQTLEQARKSGEILRRKVQTGFDSETGKPVYEEQPLDMNALPRIVVIVDEMADLMLVAGKDVEAAIQRLAQMARAAGIHLIMATQRPSVDVVTGTIKANFPTRIGFQVTSKIDSRTILGEQGAEQLLGQGDMLYMAGGGRISRVHGGFVSDEEVTDLVSFLRQQGEPEYDDGITNDDDIAAGIPGFDFAGAEAGVSSGDALYDQAIALVAREGKASTSFIQRHLQIGYNRAARIIEKMEKEGVVSQANHVGKREVLVSDQSEPEY